MGAEDDVLEVRKHIEGRRLTVKVVPNASRTGVAGTDSSGTLRIRLSAPPEKGRANKELLDFISNILGKSVRILRGSRGRTKTIEILER